MVGLVNRPPNEIAHRDGLLRKDHFQVSYVTNDLERAKRTFSERYGIGKFASLGGPMPDGGTISVAFAWVGGTLYEIIQAQGPKTEFYNRDLPSGHFAIRFHHLGFLVHDRAAWEQLERRSSRTSGRSSTRRSTAASWTHIMSRRRSSVTILNSFIRRNRE